VTTVTSLPVRVTIVRIIARLIGLSPQRLVKLRADLDRERKAMSRLWAKREAQIQGVIESTVGMYGDLQGIAGREIQEIEGLQLPLIERRT
jgi:hypothetical protein